MRKSALFVAFSLLGAAGPAAPQAPKPAPAAAEERPASSPTAPLNLKLDQPARFYTRETPPDGAGGKSAADNLPSLGGNAVTLERPPASQSRSPSSSPFPIDSERRP
jgi:hypothetical protein